MLRALAWAYAARVDDAGLNLTLDRPQLADVGRLARRLVRRTIAAARADEGSVGKLLAAHLGAQRTTLPVATGYWPGYDQVNVQTAVDIWLAEPGRTHQLVGLTDYRLSDFGLADLLQDGGWGVGVGVGSVETQAMPAGPDGATRQCVQCAIYLTNDPDGPTALLVRGSEEHGSGVAVQVVCTSVDRAQLVIDEIRRLSLEHNVFRGHVVEFGGEVFGYSGDALLSFVARPDVAREQVVLPVQVLIRAAFPPGSVTGAPKVRALEVIHELEATPREVYTGAIGYRSPLAGLELSVAIRTFEFHASRVWLGAGGGIVAASRPGEEYRECLLKAQPLIAAVGGCLAKGPAGRSRRSAGPDPGLLPRPAAGVFTSLYVREGDGQHLGAHLDRLADSARRLYGKELPASLAADLDRCLAMQPTGRLRITVRPRGGPLHATVAVVPLDNASAVTDLVPVVIPGGIGEHKWADRRLLGQLAQTAGTSKDVQLLIEDADGTVLETDRANVFAVLGNVLKTPPANGPLLPGITRARVMRLAAGAGLTLQTSPLSRQDLLSATEVFVTNSVHGVLAVRSVAGVVLTAAPGPATQRIAAALAAEPRSADTPLAEVSLARGHETGPAADTDGGFRGHLTTPASPTTATPLVVVIDNYDSFTYNLVHYLTTAGCAVEVVRNDEVTAGQVVTLGPAGVVISPGPCAPHEAGISIDVVRACALDPVAIPVLGVCLGHQAIAASFGASIIRTAPVHGQTSIISHDSRGVMSGLPRGFAATRYHSLIVAEQTLPDCLHITARTRGGIPMGLRHASLPIEGVQFHPESVLTSYGHNIIGNFVSTLPTLSRTDGNR